MNIDEWLLKLFSEKPNRDFYTKEQRSEYNKAYRLKHGFYSSSKEKRAEYNKRYRQRKTCIANSAGVESLQLSSLETGKGFVHRLARKSSGD